MTAEFLKRCWVEINLDHLKYNLEQIQTCLDYGGYLSYCSGQQPVQVMAVVKADAYGHGDLKIVQELSALGVRLFAVSNILEGVRLRKHGVTGDILVLGYTPEEQVSLAREYDIVLTVFEREYAHALSEAALRGGSPVRVHLKLDTGMNRIGFTSLTELMECFSLPGIQVEGMFTHFAVADADDEESLRFTIAQYEQLRDAKEALEAAGYPIKHLHCQNSAGLLCHGYIDGCDIVRAGIILYGLKPDRNLKLPVELKPLMELKSVVSMVKELPAGATVSYGRTYTCPSPRTIATVSLGYADGYPRLMSGRGEVLIRGRRCPVVGRVCMDQLMADVTGVEGVCAGDVVTLYGRDGDETISIDDAATLAGTINYELVCDIGPRVPRVYLRDGKVVDVVDRIQ